MGEIDEDPAGATGEYRFDKLAKCVAVQVVRFPVDFDNDGIGIGTDEKGWLIRITHLERDEIECENVKKSAK
jgi:hypothetical protein